MEDQPVSVLNEFLERIKNLEKQNETLRENIIKKKEEIKKIDTEIINSSKEENKKEIILQKKLPSEEEEEKEIKKELDNYITFKSNKINIETEAFEYTIEFISQERYNNLYIMGDFTNWEFIKMEKNKDCFTYKIILLKGYKYYYSFQAGDEIIIDYNNTYGENPLTFQIQNYIDLTENNKENFFDFKKNINLLKSLQKNYILSKLSINEEEYIFLIKLKNYTKIIKEIHNEKMEKYNYVYDSIITYYDKINKIINSNDVFNKLDKFRNYYQNRILVQNKENIIDNNINLNYYIINDISDDFVFLCEKLYDDNNIKIKKEYYTHNIFFNKILPNKIIFTKINNESKLYHLLPLIDSQIILEKYNMDNTRIIKAYFKTLLNLKNDNNINDITFNDYYLSNNIFLVKPKKVEPEGIKIDDYDFYYSYNKITKVKNKKEQIDVQFTIIDESIEKNKIPNKIEIYYGIKNNNFFLIHCHILDKNLRNEKIIIKEIKKDEDYHIYKKSEEFNNVLLLLIQDLIPIKLYFNKKKVKTNFIKLEENKIYLLQTTNNDSIYNRMYIKIINLEKKLNYDLIEQCNEFTYSFDNIKNIQNGVDIKVIFDNTKNYVSENIFLAVSPCLLKTIFSFEENIFKKKMPINDSDEMKKYFIITQRINEIKKDELNNNKEEKEKLSLELNDYNKNMVDILRYMELNELWDYMEDAVNVSQKILDYINLLSDKQINNK